MAKWRKLLQRMAQDPSPTSYTYDQAAYILGNLGFELAVHGAGSHRKWRAIGPAGSPVIIGLVERGSGCMKAYLIRDMILALRQNGFLDC
jgi:hypothetical protein